MQPLSDLVTQGLLLCVCLQSELSLVHVPVILVGRQVRRIHALRLRLRLLSVVKYVDPAFVTVADWDLGGR